MNSLQRGSIEFTTDASYVVRRPSSTEPSPLLVVLHGQGMSGELMLSLLNLPDEPPRIVVAGDGPYPFEKRRADRIDIGYGWYLYRGDQVDFRRQLEHSERHVLRLIESIRAVAPFAERRVTLLGYSQGGYLAGFIALRHPTMFRGLVLISTRLKHEFLLDELHRANPPQTLFIHSTNDPAVRWESTEEGRRLLAEAGADISVKLHDEGHRIPSDAGVWVNSWLKQRQL